MQKQKIKRFLWNGLGVTLLLVVILSAIVAAMEEPAPTQKPSPMIEYQRFTPIQTPTPSPTLYPQLKKVAQKMDVVEQKLDVILSPTIEPLVTCHVNGTDYQLTREGCADSKALEIKINEYVDRASKWTLPPSATYKPIGTPPPLATYPPLALPTTNYQQYVDQFNQSVKIQPPPSTKCIPVGDGFNCFNK